jgi:hypothetical protein
MNVHLAAAFIVSPGWNVMAVGMPVQLMFLINSEKSRRMELGQEKIPIGEEASSAEPRGWKRTTGAPAEAEITMTVRM